MGKLSKQVLALGLASGVLLSGLPLGNVVDAASNTSGKASVTKVAKAELTTKQKIAVEKKKFDAGYASFMTNKKAITDVYHKNSDGIHAVRLGYDFTEVSRLVSANLDASTKSRAAFSGVLNLYEAQYDYYAGSDSDAKVLAEYTKRNKAVDALNAKKLFDQYSKEAANLGKDVANVKKKAEALAVANRAKFEKVNPLGLVLLKRNQAWANSVNIGSVTGKFYADLIKSGKTVSESRKLASKLDTSLISLYTIEMKSAKGHLEGYVRSFNYDTSNRDHMMRTLRYLDFANNDYRDAQGRMSSAVSVAYKDAGLTEVRGAFDLK